MIITVICDVLGEENNGTTIALMNLIRSLKQKGHEVRVVCMNQTKKGEKGWYIVPEINLLALNIIIHNNGVSLAKADKKILEDAIKDCDVVHTGLVFFLSKAAIDIAKKYNKPITSSFHCQAENFSTHLKLSNCEFFNKLVYKNFYRRIYSRSDCVHYPTQFIRNIFESVTKPTNGVVISNGVNDRFKKIYVDKPDNLKDKFIILSTGRLSGEKKHSVLIKAISKSKYLNKIHLIIAGKGPLEKKAKSMAEKSGVKLEIKFFSRDELVNIINYSDLYVHPAEVEIEAIACLEAICCGLVPIIADSKKSATKHFALDEKSLFKVNNYYDLAEKIDYMIENPDELHKLSEKYLNESHSFKQSVCMDKMEEMIINTAKVKRGFTVE